MRALALLTLFAVASWDATAAPAAVPLVRDAGLLATPALAAGEGGLVLVLRPSPKPETAARGTWDALLVADDGTRWRLAAAQQPRLWRLPAGRHRIESVVAADGQRISGVMGAGDWFEVVAGRIVYAGEWWIRSSFDIDDEMTVQGRVSFGPEPLAALSREPASPLARLGFWLAPVGEPARPVTSRD